MTQTTTGFVTLAGGPVGMQAEPATQALPRATEPTTAALPSIQSLRAIAAFLVVGVHAKAILGNSGAATAFDIGYAGVDLFFVISGFIMVYSTDRSGAGAATFVIQRLCRIVPLYYLFTLTLFALAILSPKVLGSTTADWWQLVQSLLFWPFEKSPGRIYPVYFLGWTLNYEIFFYALFAAAMLLSVRMRVLIVSAALLVHAGVPVVLGPEAASSVPAYFYTRPIILDFVLGMVIAQFRHEIAGWAARWPSLPLMEIALGVVGLIALQSLLPPSHSAFAPETDTFLIYGLPCAIVLKGVVGLELNGRGLRSRLLPRLGDASYSTYLAHMHPVGAVVMVANYLDAGPLSRWMLLAIAFVGIGWASLVIHRTVERRLCQAMRAAACRLSQRSRSALAPLAGERL